MNPSVAVALEMGRAVGQGVLLLPRFLVFLGRSEKLKSEVLDDLGHPAAIDPVRELVLPRDRPLSIFVACAEVSGEIHAVNVVRALKRRVAEAGAPAARLSGFGGQRLGGEGVDIRGNPVDRAQMGLSVWSSVPWYARLLSGAAAGFREDPPDLLLAVDSPALHVPLARIAQRYGVPTVHFVTPQYWGWAPWRARAYREAVACGLTILPFEKVWFARRGIDVAHVGHPLVDELASVAPSVPRDDARELVILPGSRSGVIDRNLPWMLRAAAAMRARVGDVPVVVAHDRADVGESLRAMIDRAGASGWARLEIGDLHACLARARTALSVSGTVLLDVLHHALPTVVVYRLGHRHEAWLAKHVLTVPWFASVNLLAGSEVYPEHCFAGEGPFEEVVDDLVRLHTDAGARSKCLEGMSLAKERLGPAGACERAARHALLVAAGAQTSARFA
jgi:lipid-A-disaccharide synthase